MNNLYLLAWMDDWQMSARLAKLSTMHSYDLNFYGNDFTVYKNKIPAVLIVDLLRLSKNDLNDLLNIPKTELLTIIGYLHQVSAAQVKYFKNYGCHMVIGRNELLKNLHSILKKIFYAD